jgi:PAS domain S-box-containing protein
LIGEHGSRSGMNHLHTPADSLPAAHCLAGGGRMGEMMRGHDWSATPVGPVESWPQSLQTSVSICLNSRFPIILFWGPELVQFYNDAYRPILGATKHPHALGQRAEECWPEIWHVIGPMLRGVLATGDATWSENLLLIMDRNAYTEETYFTFSYSPIRDELGIGGVFCAVTETTNEVLGERRMRILNDLSARASDARTAEEACVRAARTLATNDSEIPFAVSYLLDASGVRARAVGCAGIEPGSAGAPTVIDLADDDSAWPVGTALRSGSPVVVTGLSARFGALPGGPWPEAPATALVLPLLSPTLERPAGVLVAGVSPRRAFDERYRAFFELVASHISTAIANARAYEQERRRAEGLAELDHAKTAFFSNVSHEFRTPLTLILGPVDDALADRTNRLPTAQRARLELVKRNGLRLLKLVNSLLDFSRIEAGRVEAVYEPTDLARMTADLASVFRSAIERAGLQLEVDCPPLPGDVFVDREMWEKIVLNLLSNAFKFTLQGAIRVSLADAGDRVELRVSDTGIGIAAEELSHLFERFHRVRGARARTQEGTGIGLALVQELVRLHGGTVQVTSRLGQGTSFVVSVPLGSAHLPPERLGVARSLDSTALGAAPYVEEALRWLPEPSAFPLQVEDASGPMAGELDALARAARRPSGERDAERILLVDDNADLREYLQRLLSERWTVEAVADGAAALEAVRQRRPDLVLTDVMLPVLDGFALLRALRADQSTRDLPVVMLSARAGEEARVEGLDAGADDYLVKPFSARELVARLSGRLALAQERREAERRVSGILESISDGFMAFDAAWRFTYINHEARGFLHAMGRTPSALIGEHVWENFPELVGTRLEQEYHRAMAEQVTVTFEFFYAEHGIWFEIRAYPSPKGLSAYFRDVTERKLAEVERERLLAAEREARAQAEAANRAKDDFLSIVSHELRTPLTPLLGYTQVLRSGRLDPARAEQALEAIERSAKAQAQLVGDILDVSRIITGKLPLERVAVDLGAVIEAAMTSVRLAAETRQITVHASCDPAGVQVVGDFGRLQQVLWNLLANAVKFTPPGGYVEVALKREGSAACIVVRDTGIGIPAEFLPHIFERFSQANVSHTREHGGLGLGLAIVKHLVELHGGTVAAASAGQNRGAAFTVTLPMSTLEVEPPERETTDATAPASEHAPGRLPGLDVLVVDDDRDTRDLLALILEQEGARVRSAASALQALAALDQRVPDLLVSDVGMPDADGYALVEAVRRRTAAAGGAVPAIALTAYAGSDDRRRALSAGFQEHLPKPLDAEALVHLAATMVGSNA